MLKDAGDGRRDAEGGEVRRGAGLRPRADPGEVIHEMGTARMGRDPKTSFLNGFNQCHESPNVS
jgi:choline dehydrogenase-like flavoprotein